MPPAAFRLAALALWAVLLGLAFLTAPPASPDTGAQVLRMLTGQLEGLNLSLFALFNLMGVWPAALAVALRFDASPLKWPFVLGSFALGAFALLPWLVLRPWGTAPTLPATRVGRFLGSRWLRRGLALAFAALLALFVLGDLPAFAVLWRTQQFPYVMSLDFAAMGLAAALLAVERGLTPAPPAAARG
jgi:hypothetical protein